MRRRQQPIRLSLEISSFVDPCIQPLAGSGSSTYANIQIRIQAFNDIEKNEIFLAFYFVLVHEERSYTEVKN